MLSIIFLMPLGVILILIRGITGIVLPVVSVSSVDVGMFSVIIVAFTFKLRYPHLVIQLDHRWRCKFPTHLALNVQRRSGTICDPHISFQDYYDKAVSVMLVGKTGVYI